jgi:hypothetical protein
MIRHSTVLCVMGFLLALSVSASPYIRDVCSIEVGGQRWGVWRIIDFPTKQYSGDIFGGRDFKTYWIFSLGSHGQVAVPEGRVLASVLVIVALAAALVYVWHGRRTRTKPCAPPNDVPAAPSRKPGVKHVPPSGI